MSLLGPVVNFSATYIPESNIVLVTWEDVDSVMMMTESNNTYEVFYDITVAGILLLTDSGEPEGDDLAGNFNFTISEEEFFQAGVSVNVTVVATDMINMTYATSMTAEIDGGKRKPLNGQPYIDRKCSHQRGFPLYTACTVPYV